jgi:uncharacterized protein (UPF0276 family)
MAGDSTPVPREASMRYRASAMGKVSVGLGVRDALVPELLALRDARALDVLEVMLDEGLEASPRTAAWRRLGARWPLIAHGTELGIGDAAGLDAAYVARAHAALRALHVHWYSEHLSFLRAGHGAPALGHFAPLGDDDDARAVLAANAALVRAGAPGPLLLENPWDVLGQGAHEPGAGERLGRAFGRALRAADAGALLDLTNLVLDARNGQWEPGAFLAQLEMDRVVEVHLAGGHRAQGLWIDSHAHDVDEEALALLGVLAPRASNLRAVVIERDERIPPLEALLAEVARARAVLS